MSGIHIQRTVSVFKVSDHSRYRNFPYSSTFSSVFHQERLLHRNSDFHATQDNRGITQRTKRSPGKQPEAGTISLFFPSLDMHCLLCSHLDTDMCQHFVYLPIFIFQALTLNLVHLMTKEIKRTTSTLWCTCISLCLIQAKQEDSVFGGNSIQCT